MANADLRTFVEDRLQALIPGIDLEPGSPAQLQFIEPLIKRLGTDPFETDIDSFITDRFQQEYPEIYAANAGAVRDAFIKPLILMLEPFKRESQGFKLNQSFADPTTLSDDDADALAANVFTERDSGGKSGGVARVYYPNPATVSVQMGNRFFTADGLSFYPSTPMTISAEEMAFNRSGLLYFMDIPVQAESEGAEYNIDANQLVGVDGLLGYVKVDNLRRFTDGIERVDTPTFIATARESLSERSLLSRRGANARLKEVFRGSLRAIQVIGAKDPEMQRDILVADAPGQVWATGKVGLYGSVALVEARTLEESSIAVPPRVGDTLYIYLPKKSWPAEPQGSRLVRLAIDEVLAQPYAINVPSGEFEVGYLLRWSDPNEMLPASFSLPFVGEGGLIRKGSVHIGSLPSVGAVDFNVANQEVHVLGHSDIYVRPVLQPASTVVLSGLYDNPGAKDFKLQRLTLSTAAGSNIVEDPGADFGDVTPGDVLTIEAGADAGAYVIGSIDSHASRLYLTSNLTATAAGSVRYRVTKKITINPFEPKIAKLPFGDVPSADLATQIGSDVFTFSAPTTDLLVAGVAVGDVVRVENGPDSGDFTITGIISGKSVKVHKSASSSSTSLRYQVFTALDPVERPLVRLKSVTLLDSSKKSTGVTVPYAEPIAVVPTSDFTSAQVRGYSQWHSGFVLPDLFAKQMGSLAAVSGDRRYSLGFDPVEGGDYVATKSGPADTLAELLFPADCKGSCSYFVAVCEDLTRSENFPPVDPKPGDALTLKSGPNKGSYTIEKVRKFKYLTAAGNTAWVYFVKVLGGFPVDVVSSVYDALTSLGVAVDVLINPATPIAFPGFFTDIYDGLPLKLQTALANQGITADLAGLKAVLDNVFMVDYEWGDPARGVLRSYFYEPTLFQQHTAGHSKPTLYSLKNAAGEVLKFRADPTRYLRHEVLPGRMTADTDVLSYPRDLSVQLPFPPPPVPNSTATFTDSARASAFAAGVLVGDILSVHEEVFFYGKTGASSDRMTALITSMSSSTVRAPTSAGAPFTDDLYGNLLFIDEGDDEGAYRVVEVRDSETLILDRPLTRSTPNIVFQGSGASWGFDAGLGKNVVRVGQAFSGAQVKGKYITIFGIDPDFQGSYEILDVDGADDHLLYVDRSLVTGDFGAYPVTDDLRWVITDPPTKLPEANVSGKGTELYGLQPVRIYSDIPSDYPIGYVELGPDLSSVDVEGTMRPGERQPYRICRPNLRRVNPTEMAAKQDGAFFYFDTEVISLGPSPAHNIPRNSYLTAVDGTYEAEGYKHRVDDFTLTYSMQESGVLELPTKILPRDVPDTLDNYLGLMGVPAEVAYERASVVEDVQNFIESVEDRTTAANMLARHFLPTYVSYDASYVGGSAASVVAKDISNFIDALEVQTPIDVSEIEKLITGRGGNPKTPTKVFVVIHDWDRKQWMEFSENELGGLETKVPYHGTPRVCFFIPGPDVSGLAEKPLGERINLTKE
jgi:hypothetical protein